MKISKVVSLALLSGVVVFSGSETLLEVNKSEAVSPTQKYSVKFAKAVDGDTVKVYKNGKLITLRLLLIDTPETVHPKLGVQPYGKEASAMTKSLISKGQKLTIEYDKGARTDKYGRHLVYLYSNGKSVQKTLLNKGLARVGYIYSQTRYLKPYKSEEAVAKKYKRGIWKYKGYVNTSGEGFNSRKSTTTVVSKPKPIVSSSYNFSNCTELKKVYPNGVYKTHKAYQLKMDRDKDGYACEPSRV